MAENLSLQVLDLQRQINDMRERLAQVTHGHEGVK